MARGPGLPAPEEERNGSLYKEELLSSREMNGTEVKLPLPEASTSPSAAGTMGGLQLPMRSSTAQEAEVAYTPATWEDDRVRGSPPSPMLFAPLPQELHGMFP